MQHDDYADTGLGKAAEYVSRYTPSLLQPVLRSRLRAGLLPEGGGELPFEGADLWTAWELSWLDRDGKPEVAVAQIRVPCQSRAVVESKSLKLYLGSYAQTPFASTYDVARTLEADLSVTVGGQVVVDLLSLNQTVQAGVGVFPGESLDTLRVGDFVYMPDPGLLSVADENRIVSETLHTNLFRSLCPATGQPDIASVQVVYSGPLIDRESLLRYLVSFREYPGFHERCVEKIFLELMERCSPRELSVHARYLRRGGIDINPYRSTGKGIPAQIRLARQ